MKQVILLRKDLKLPIGKACVQTAHGSVEAVLNSDKKKIEQWRKEGMKKVVLKVENEKELLICKKKADALKITTSLIKDAAKTFFKKPTITCLAIGPDKEEKIDKVTGSLKML
ncbi:peptidyl-tRNA hydrolase [Candidatus Woesearchaeota archaeon]|nr:peptidyl-tRNA hydrolase [Candidatus Woesearchaeota archaeon]